MIGIEDVRDGRTHLVRTTGDFERWLVSFTRGRCEPAAFGVCGLCDRIHRDRDADGEILLNCVACAAELIEIAAERYLGAGRDVARLSIGRFALRPRAAKPKPLT